MSAGYDVIVVGLGAMGGATADELARRGRRVLALDRFAPPHARGSSHGESRIIREAYFEDPLYVPLVQRAWERWEDLARWAGRELLRPTGGLLVGPPDGTLVTGALRSARAHGLACERLDAAAIRRRFPCFAPDDAMVGILEPRAGVLLPEACIEAMHARARAHGAVLVPDEPVHAWRADGAGVEVTTSRDRHRAGRLLIAAGAWTGTLLTDLALPLAVTRQTLFWFEPAAAEMFDPARCPVHIWEPEAGHYFYGFPALGGAVKVAPHGGGTPAAPDAPRREVEAGEIEAMRVLLRRYLPRADGPLRSSATCLYTNTPDGHFLVDVHPHHPQVVIASVCSGHGFKFASAMGEVLADLLLEKQGRFDLGPFRLGRLLRPPAPGTGATRAPGRG